MANRHYADHAEEESYFASMTDVFIGLLFIFIIMLMFFAMRFQEATQEQKEVNQTLADATEKQKEVTKQQKELIDDLTASEAARDELLQNIGSFLQSRGLNVTIIKDEGILRLPEEMLFAKSNWELSAKGVDASRVVRSLAEALDQVLPCYTSGTRSRDESCPKTRSKIEAIYIEGHADADAYSARRRPVNPPGPVTNGSPPTPGVFSIFRRDAPPAPVPAAPAESRPSAALLSAPPRDNLDLSTLRATSTFRELMRVKRELGLYLNPTGKPVLSVSGYGEYRPVTAEPGESAETFKQRNRRIDLRILMASPRSEDAKQIEQHLNHIENK
ncbi:MULTISPECIES: OmpA/MotB family protein [unclassified Bradyrhizobium]|uniref:OmpA/MotB family protein n=1 Tax=unclassified Bradyrhizobium TaxID=2631580 RepID=UPI002FF2385C